MVGFVFLQELVLSCINRWWPWRVAKASRPRHSPAVLSIKATVIQIHFTQNINRHRKHITLAYQINFQYISKLILPSVDQQKQRASTFFFVLMYVYTSSNFYNSWRQWNINSVFLHLIYCIFVQSRSRTNFTHLSSMLPLHKSNTTPQNNAYAY